jgi:hypothetical protein
MCGPYDQDQPKQVALTIGSRDIGMSLAPDFVFVEDIRVKWARPTWPIGIGSNRDRFVRDLSEGRR